MRMGEILALFGGVQVVIAGFFAFVGKMWLNSVHEKQRARVEVEIEAFRAEASANSLRLQHALDRRLHVHALQFEKEQKVYEEIWATLIEMAKSVSQLRPPLDYHKPEETEEQRKLARLSRLSESAQRFLDQVNKERPFYARDVYDKLHELGQIVRVEAIEYQYGDASELSDYWRKALENSKAISAKIDEVCEVIRRRIGEISAA